MPKSFSGSGLGADFSLAPALSSPWEGAAGAGQAQRWIQQLLLASCSRRWTAVGAPGARGARARGAVEEASSSRTATATAPGPGTAAPTARARGPSTSPATPRSARPMVRMTLPKHPLSSRSSRTFQGNVTEHIAWIFIHGGSDSFLLGAVTSCG